MRLAGTNIFIDLYKNMANQIGLSDLSDAAQNALRMRSSDFSSPIITNTYDSILTVGTILVLMYFLINVLEESTREHFTAEQAIKAFIKLAIAEIAVMKSDKIVVIFCNITNALINKMLMNLSLTPLSSDLASDIDTWGFFRFLVEFVLLLLPWIISMVINVIIVTICFSRKIEIVVRSCLMPIGISDIINGGYHSNGIRYLKRLISVMLQGVVIVACCSASYGLIASDTFMNAFPFLPETWMGTIQGILVFTLIKGASGIANDLIS